MIEKQDNQSVVNPFQVSFLLLGVFHLHLSTLLESENPSSPFLFIPTTHVNQKLLFFKVIKWTPLFVTSITPSKRSHKG